MNILLNSGLTVDLALFSKINKETLYKESYFQIVILKPNPNTPEEVTYRKTSEVKRVRYLNSIGEITFSQIKFNKDSTVLKVLDNFINNYEATYKENDEYIPIAIKPEVVNRPTKVNEPIEVLRPTPVNPPTDQIDAEQVNSYDKYKIDLERYNQYLKDKEVYNNYVIELTNYNNYLTELNRYNETLTEIISSITK